MAEILEAVLQLDINAFTAALQQAAQQVTAFAQAISGSMGSTATAFQQQVQQINQLTAHARQSTEAVGRARKAQVDEEVAHSTALYKYRQEIQQTTLRQMLTNEVRTVQEAKTAEQRALQERGNFYRQMEAEKQAIFRQTTQREVEEQTRRVAAERQAAAETLAVWKKAGHDLDRLDAERRAKEEMRFRARNAATNLQADLNIAGGLGGVNSSMYAMQLQGWINMLDQATPKMSFFESGIARIGTSIRTLAGYFAASAILSIPFVLAEWAKEAVNVALKMQSLDATFRAITGSAGKASEELSFLRTTANRVGVDFLETATQFRNLEAAARGTTLEGGRVRAIFEAITATSRVMGLSSEQTARALLALEQMISKGTISAEELRKQLSQAIPGAVGIMARALGIGTDELSKMMKEGSLLAEEVLPRFAAQLQKEFGPGLEQAAKTAQATFARLGNEVREVSVGIGNTLLKALQPAAEFIAGLLKSARMASELAEKERGKIGAELAAGKPITGYSGTTLSLDGAATQQEIDQAMGLVKKIAEGRQLLHDFESGRYTSMMSPERANRLKAELQAQEAAFNNLNKAIEERVRLSKQLEIDEFGGKATAGQGMVDAQNRYKKAVEEVLALHKSMPVEIQKAISLAKAFPDVYESAEVRLKAIKKTLGEYQDLLAKDPNLRLNPDILAAEKKTADMAKAAQDEIDAIKEKERAEKEYAAETKRLANQRLTDLRQEASEREKIENDLQLMIAEQTEGETEKKLEALNIKLNKAREVGADETLIAAAGAAARTKIYAEEAAASMKIEEAKYNKIRERVEKQAVLEDLVTAVEAKGNQTRLDDFYAAQDAKRRKLEEGVASGLIGMETLNEFEGAVAQAAGRIVVDEHEKAAKAAEKSWRELANTIESTLAGVFQSLLSGSKNLFESIRDAFLKLLAKLAADALTHAVIIPAIIQFVGGGGGAGGGGGVSGFTGAGGGGANGGGDMLSTATGLAGAGIQSYQMLSGGSLLGAGGLTAGLLSTQIGTIGASYGAGVGAPYIGQSTLLGELGIGATSVGTVVGGIGAGIAVGMMLKQINNMIGIKGTAGSALAGAGGGALAGSIILPGIGTAIGAVVGAIGGALAGILSKPAKQPGFDIERMQGGRIEYDESTGLRMTQNFKILDDFHQKLGTDYEEFIYAMDASINEMFQEVVSQVSSATPEVQRALVGPLNNAFQSIADQIANYPKIGGGNFKEQLEVMMKDFAKIFSGGAGGAIEELLEAVQKIDPVIQAFTKIIDSLLVDIKELQDQQKALHEALQGNMKSLEESLMNPAQMLLRRKQEFAALLKEFEAGDESTKIRLAPQVGEMSNTILELTKSVVAQTFGDISGIEVAMKQLAESSYTQADLLRAREADLATLLEQFRSGNDVQRTQLSPAITQLALEIAELSKAVFDLSGVRNAITQLKEGLLNPTQTKEARQAELQALLDQFYGGDDLTKAGLSAQITDLALQIFALAKAEDQSLNPSGVQGAIKQLQEALATPAQLLASRQDELTRLMDQFRSGTQAIRVGLTPQITSLALEIMQLSQSVDNLADAQALMAEFPGQLRAIREALYSPAQSYLSQQGQLQAMLTAFRGGTPEEQRSLQPQIAALAAEIMSLAQRTEVLGQDPQLLRVTQANLLAIVEEVQQTIANQAQSQGNDAAQLRAVLERTQADMIAVLREVEGVMWAGSTNTANTVAGWSNALYQQQAYLISVLQGVEQSLYAASVWAGSATTNAVYTMTSVLREVQYAMAGVIANTGAQTIQAIWGSAGEITRVNYVMSNGIITAEYQTADGIIRAEYDSTGHLINTEHYIGGVMVGHVDNTTNTVGAWSNYLYQQQSYLINIVAHARDIAWLTYDNLMHALWTEIGLAQEQIRLLVNSLYHLETVEAVVAHALAILGDMNARLGNPLNVRMEGDLNSQLQRDSLYVAQQAYNLQGRIGQSVIALLAKPAFGLDWNQGQQLGRDVTGGFQHGGFVSRNMIGFLHRGEQVIPEWDNRGGGGRNVTITVYGGTKDPGQIADIVIQRIEQKSGRLQSGTIQTSRR